MLTTTITDELRLSTGKRSKVVGIAIKDRGASFPAGHTGDAYWYDDTNGDWMTSTYYKQTLPSWVANFNAKKRPDHYLSQTWKTLFPVETYVNSLPDQNEFESPFVGKDSPSFSLRFSRLERSQWGLLHWFLPLLLAIASP